MGISHPFAAQAGDEPAGAAAAQLFAAARLCASTDCRVVLIGDDRRLAAAAGPRLRDPVRVDFSPYGPAAVAAAVAAAGERRGALAFGGGDRAVYGAFCAAVAAVAKRATSDVGELLVLASSRPVPNSNLQPDFNVSICDGFDAISSAVLRELDESNRSVQKSAESTSI